MCASYINPYFYLELNIQNDSKGCQQPAQQQLTNSYKENDFKGVEGNAKNSLSKELDAVKWPVSTIIVINN